MEIVIPNAQGEARPAWAGAAADRMIAFSKKYGFWGTCEFIVETWLRRHPEEYYAFKRHLQAEKENVQDDFASNEDRRHGNMRMRRLVEVPSEVMLLIEILFREEIEQYKGGKVQFYRDFAQHFPIFKLAKKI